MTTSAELPPSPSWPPSWPTPPGHPPSPPEWPPGRTEPGPAPRGVPTVIPAAQPAGSEDVFSALLARRMVLVAGPLTTEVATRAGAELMLLDAEGRAPVRLHLSCPEGDLDAALALADTVELMRPPVHAMASGVLGGAALAPYLAAGKRLAGAHASFLLREPQVELSGPASQVAAAAAAHVDRVAGFVARLAGITGRAVEEVAADLRAGRRLDAEEAVRYGLVQEIVGAGRN